MYNDHQLALIEAPIDKRVIGVAGAGTGKTTTILARTKRILSEYSTGNILLITFTRAAANDLRTRLEKELSQIIVGSHYRLQKTEHLLMPEIFVGFRLEPFIR